ncbi:unnamed protein product [Moneuplotes crassus]|uniref:Origin recognition complex subunit 2 n=1 Tax=Euplotes crassus TaxID=5936 RepID=A0AAD1XDF0_EUPCR|nr:unnamed protein product [Moneuplotes crassus]
MDVDSKPADSKYLFGHPDGMMQDLNELNDMVDSQSLSSQSVNDEDNSDDGEIDIKEEQKGHHDDRFSKQAQNIAKKDKMAFMNYFTCRTQRVQLKSDSEDVGKKNFSEFFKKNQKLEEPNRVNRLRKEREERKGDRRRKEERERQKQKEKEKDLTEFAVNYAENPNIAEESKTTSYEEQLHDSFSTGDGMAKSICCEFKDEMYYMLESGLNLAIYGVGSKINFLKHFTMGLKDHAIVVGNCYHPGLTLKGVLKELTTYINNRYMSKKNNTVMKQMNKFFSMGDNVEYLLKTLSIESLNISKIYIILISIDSGNLKSLELQRHLSVLARCDKIGIIVTTDTLKPAAFWDDSVLDRYNFVFYQIDTYEEYGLEKSMSTPLFSLKNEREELGLAFILKSFTDMQVDAIKILAKFQLDNPHELGMKERELYEECVDMQSITDIKTLKDILREIRDHKILFEREDKEGNSYLYLKLKASILEKIIKNQLQADD